MVWSDEPTDLQIQTLYNWLSWRLPTNMAVAACDFIEEHATRREVSNEMTRIRDLYYKYDLRPETAFTTDVWEGFDYKEYL